ncbi:ParB N-terminal domain-containing protein [Noviherbaspirillum pedocola]|uniref:ParB/Sulfiredoxin domain-containing protein n=1 Tax=Noviherbaspirillum pedocola TaxID=2801341 RepID=A0A934W3L9_9BURK|nr:hypothetical protein [Noviherbaspirillum pedocola]MBK4737576.1 hypothetical protein [Noviherbaspirillum pedocola]
MDQEKRVTWLKEPAQHTYTSAEIFLQLMYKPKKAKRLVEKLRHAGMSEYAARDILRASATLMSWVSAFDWSKQQQAINSGTPISPILLVRQNDGGHLIVADGFHRMCALFAEDQDIKVPCKIA